MLDLAGIEPTGHLTVSDEEAINAARRLAKEEGLFFSSGANLAAALQLLGGPHRGGTVVVLNDTGLKI